MHRPTQSIAALAPTHGFPRAPSLLERQTVRLGRQFGLPPEWARVLPRNQLFHTKPAPTRTAYQGLLDTAQRPA